MEQARGRCELGVLQMDGTVQWEACNLHEDRARPCECKGGMCRWEFERHVNMLLRVPTGSANDPEHRTPWFFHTCTFIHVRPKVVSIHDAKRVWVTAAER